MDNIFGAKKSSPSKKYTNLPLAFCIPVFLGIEGPPEFLFNFIILIFFEP
nr:hypothetical protein [Mammaliicoccus lentus]